MKTLDNIFTEEQVNDVSQKILKATIKKITDEISNNFYAEMESCIYEHYDNSKERIESDLIRDITETFIKDPTSYKYKSLREKLFVENKDMLIKILTDEAIENSVACVIEEYTHLNYVFNWRWKDAIIRIIADNWDMFKNDERVNSGLLRKIERLSETIKKLKEEITNLNTIANE